MLLLQPFTINAARGWSKPTGSGVISSALRAKGGLHPRSSRMELILSFSVPPKLLSVKHLGFKAKKKTTFSFRSIRQGTPAPSSSCTMISANPEISIQEHIIQALCFEKIRLSFKPVSMMSQGAGSIRPRSPLSGVKGMCHGLKYTPPGCFKASVVAYDLPVKRNSKKCYNYSMWISVKIKHPTKLCTHPFPPERSDPPTEGTSSHVPAIFPLVFLAKS